MHSITKVLVATTMLSGFSMAAPHNVQGSDEQPSLDPPGWPSEEYSTTKVVTTTPAGCFSKTVVKCSTKTPWVPKTLTSCMTEMICSETTKMVEGTPITSYVPQKPVYTPMPPSKKPEWEPMSPPMPKLTTSCITKYSTKNGKTCSSTQSMVSFVTPPAKQPIWTPLPANSTPSSSSSCKKTSSPIAWFPSGNAVTSPASKSSAQPSKSASMSAQSSVTSSCKATSSMKATASKSMNSTSKFTMPTRPIPTMESSASGFGGVSSILGVVAVFALVMAAL